ncbi:MAG: hypothetical protein QF415_14435 [Candidatus Undinarchaeales archaeon]|jgi:hypothetical protein|nr:hypothetical protein [Candidatus Undinarchaeales archaeon]MDP7493190.1 hypothetical protein [Candidatus Undinarchaeales archaeon]
MPTMQVDNEEVEELSNRLLKVVKDYTGEVAELNPSEIALALSLVPYKLWKEMEGAE